MKLYHVTVTQHGHPVTLFLRCMDWFVAFLAGLDLCDDDCHRIEIKRYPA